MTTKDDVDWSFLESVYEKGLLQEAILELRELDRRCRDDRIRKQNAYLMCSLVEATAYMRNRYFKSPSDESYVTES